jgi:hypothetical protein
MAGTICDNDNDVYLNEFQREMLHNLLSIRFHKPERYQYKKVSMIIKTNDKAEKNKIKKTFIHSRSPYNDIDI